MDEVSEYGFVNLNIGEDTPTVTFHTAKEGDAGEVDSSPPRPGKEGDAGEVDSSPPHPEKENRTSPANTNSSTKSWEDLGIDPEDYDVVLTDVNYEKMHLIEDLLGVKNLSAAEWPTVPFPKFGIIYGPQIRYMVALTCRLSRKHQPIQIIFLADTGSVHTYLDKATIRALKTLLPAFRGRSFEPKIGKTLFIQDSEVVIEYGESHGSFDEANLLGQEAKRALNLNYITNWKKRQVALVREPKIVGLDDMWNQ